MILTLLLRFFLDNFVQKAITNLKYCSSPLEALLTLTSLASGFKQLLLQIPTSDLPHNREFFLNAQLILLTSAITKSHHFVSFPECELGRILTKGNHHIYDPLFFSLILIKQDSFNRFENVISVVLCSRHACAICVGR